MPTPCAAVLWKLILHRAGFGGEILKPPNATQVFCTNLTLKTVPSVKNPAMQWERGADNMTHDATSRKIPRASLYDVLTANMLLQKDDSNTSANAFADNHCWVHEFVGALEMDWSQLVTAFDAPGQKQTEAVFVLTVVSIN